MTDNQRRLIESTLSAFPPCADEGICFDHVMWSALHGAITAVLAQQGEQQPVAWLDERGYTTAPLYAGAAPAAQPTCKQDLPVETEQERYVRLCPDIECGRKKQCTRMVGVSCMSRADIAPAAQIVNKAAFREFARWVEMQHGIGVDK